MWAELTLTREFSSVRISFRKFSTSILDVENSSCELQLQITRFLTFVLLIKLRHFELIMKLMKQVIYHRVN